MQISGISVLVTALLALSARGALASQETKEQKQGQLVYVNGHDGEEDYLLLDNDAKKMHKLGKDKKPKKDKDGKDIAIGDYLVLACTADPTTGQCTYISDQDVTKLGSPPVPQAVGVAQRVLVMLVDNPDPKCGNATAETTVDALKTRYLGAALDGTGGIAARMENCSYGELIIDKGPFTVIKVTPACTWSVGISTCDYQGIYNAAMAKATTDLAASGIDIQSYTHYHIIINQKACLWSALGTFAGNVVWAKASAINSWSIAIHEMLHNYMLWHAYKDYLEYSDKSSLMGSGFACPCAPELALLQWATPAAGGDLDGASIPLSSAAAPATSGPVQLAATWARGAGAYVRVKPKWMANYGVVGTGPTAGRNLYFEVRQDRQADASIALDLIDALVVHSVVAYLDNDYAAYRKENRTINFITAIPPDTRAVLTAFNLVVYTGTYTGDALEILPVAFCRYASADAECPPLSAAFISRPPSPPASPSRPPSPPPPPVSPPPPPPPPTPPSPAPPPSPSPPSPKPPTPPPSPAPPSPRPPNPSPPPSVKKSPTAKPGERNPPLPPMPPSEPEEGETAAPPPSPPPSPEWACEEGDETCHVTAPPPPASGTKHHHHPPPTHKAPPPRHHKNPPPRHNRRLAL
ncbi:hypothetical protein HXX76_015130 [Chlamydomonas incerta]|uniref:Peptidase M11 gametolysin domain-containing protein n=1 Tax=Chlamydomonas incerta TaxID=51695 RepID=A0A835SPP4_CHLIN|nr:hypothetical protein HXX76_015130 [Chlamydomonas incerta]|eukprot:KAG2423741.1 hypothetical protein HXX76_015130 [Chlamydomonas incerta]